MSEPRFLLVRLGSMGDVIHALPAASALRDTFPKARIDWAVEPRWARLLKGNPDLNSVIQIDRKSASGIAGTVQELRAAKYGCAIDFQALYKSALLARASGAAQRIGFQSSYAREGLAAVLYTDRLNPRGAHKVDHNLTLAEFAGAGKAAPRFPIAIEASDEETMVREVSSRGIDVEREAFFVLNPGGGWRSKCWAPERYGELHNKLAQRWNWRGVVSYGPGEEDLAQRVVDAAGTPVPVPVPLGLGPVMALLRRARFVASADTGPLHLAAALGTRVIGLFGPTDPARNGPYHSGVVVRNPRNCETTYQRGKGESPSMQSITVEQVSAAVERCLQSRAEPAA
jgi:heptosyltransferase-1